MIVGSMLLILVAVTLLIAGLGGGSSALLISSIVASLLAAVALVIGARQASGGRRAAPAGPEQAPLTVDLDDDPGPAAPVEETAAWADPSADPDPFTADDDAVAARSSVVADEPVAGDVAAAETMVVTRDSWADADPAPADRAGDPARASAADTEILTREPGPAPQDPDPPTGPGSLRAGGASEADDASPHRSAGAPDGTGATVRAEVDDPYAEFHRERSTIAAPPAGDADPAAEHRPADEHLADRVADDADDEDPPDEPPAQRLQPGDAVRVARLIAEVLVVDGRPRYHLGDCPSLTGRITEPLPAAEAVELGFTPCSMCRPVDRLVAEAVPR